MLTLLRRIIGFGIFGVSSCALMALCLALSKPSHPIDELDIFLLSIVVAGLCLGGTLLWKQTPPAATTDRQDVQEEASARPPEAAPVIVAAQDAKASTQFQKL